MSTSSLYSSTANLARKHSRVTLLAAGAAAAGMLGVAGASIGSGHSAQAIGNVAQTTAQTSSNQSRTSALDEVLGGQAAKIQPAHQQPAASHASHTQLTSVRGPSKPAKAAPAAPAAPAAKPASPAAHAVLTRSNSSQHQAAPQHRATPQHQAAPQHRAAQPKPNPGPTEPYLVYDSVTPSTLPSGQPAAVYADGAYAAYPSQVSGHSSVLWIDTNGSDPNANVLDVEPGDATPAGAAPWVQAHLSAQPHSVAIVYTMLSDWSAVQDSIGTLPSWMQSDVRYWIADPTGVPHVVPGSSATQWYWGNSYDISTANPNFQQQ